MATIKELSDYIQQRLRDADLDYASAKKASGWVVEEGLLDGQPLGTQPILHILQSLVAVEQLRMFPGARLELITHGD